MAACTSGAIQVPCGIYWYGIRAVKKPLVLIPVYNHGTTLRRVVKGVLAQGFPCLVVDDGSTDQGIATIEDLDCYRHVLPENRGKGAAILAGAGIARQHGFDSVITIDADGQHHPEDIHVLVRAASECRPCMVIGERTGMEGPGVPASSRFGRKFSNFWIRLECGAELPDTQSGFRLYPLEVLLDLPFRCRRYDFEVEVIVRAVWAGIPVKSVPVSVTYAQKGERVSHFRKFADNLRLTLLHTWLVLRALWPAPHRRLVEQEVEKISFQAVRHPLRFLRRLCREHSSPGMLATAAWLGLFLGALPLIACHTIVIIYVAHKLNLNKVAAVGASQFCCPPVVPVLCVETGYFLRYGHFLTDAGFDTLILQIHQRLWEYFIGSLVLGPLLGFAGAAIVYGASVYYRRRGCETD